MSSAGNASDEPSASMPGDADRLARRQRTKRLLFSALKWGLFVLVLVFVANRAHAMWKRDGATLSGLSIHWGWIAAAVASNGVAWVPSIWFWRRLMQGMGTPPPLLAAARAYCCGQLGKYIPGKAAVVVIRAGLVKPFGVRTAHAALAVGYESLAMMGSGVAIAAALAPRLVSSEQRAALPQWLQPVLEHAWLPPVIVAVVTASLLPVLAILFTYVTARMTPAEILEREGPPRISAATLGSGLLAYIATWTLYGASLAASLRALGVTTFALADLPTLVGAVSFATSIGFAAIFAPGGLGVREGLLIAALNNQPFLTPSDAVAAAVVHRSVSFVSELVMAGVLYSLIRGAPSDVRTRDEG